MKFTKAIILFTIIAIAACAEADRTEKVERKNALKAKSKASTETCKEYTVTVLINNDSTKSSTGVLNSSFLKTPSGDQLKGVLIKFTTLNDDLKKLLVASGDYYFIPYRQTVTDFSTGGTDATGKTLTATIQVSGTASTLTIQFAADATWTTIEDSELTLVAGWINTNKTTRQNEISSLKKTAQTLANDYYTNYLSLVAAKAGTAAISAQITKNKESITTYNTQMSTAQTDSDTLQTQINTKNTELTALQKTLDETSTSITAKTAEVEACQGAVTTLTNSKNGESSDTNSAKSKASAAKSSLDSCFSSLTTEYPQDADQTTITSAKTEIFTNLSTSGLATQLAKLTSS
jgi:predicted  nucleic acid-binding Zn-ribbon protein